MNLAMRADQLVYSAKGKVEGKRAAKLETIPLLRESGLLDETIAEKLNLPLSDARNVPRDSAPIASFPPAISGAIDVPPFVASKKILSAKTFCVRFAFR